MGFLDYVILSYYVVVLLFMYLVSNFTNQVGFILLLLCHCLPHCILVVVAVGLRVQILGLIFWVNRGIFLVMFGHRYFLEIPLSLFSSFFSGFLGLFLGIFLVLFIGGNLKVFVWFFSRVLGNLQGCFVGFWWCLDLGLQWDFK